MGLPEILDIHTHTVTETAIVQVNALRPITDKPKFCTVSIHPWDAHLITPEEAKDALEKVIERFRPVGIGETGIDRAIKTDINTQKDLFELHLHYAEKLRLPVIIHSVRALSDVSIYIKKHPALTFIFHSYWGNIDQTRWLLNYKTFFSFGKRLLKIDSAIDTLISIIPPDRVLIETDDSGLPIETFLSAMSQKVGVSIEKIQPILIANTKSAFNL